MNCCIELVSFPLALFENIVHGVKRAGRLIPGQAKAKDNRTGRRNLILIVDARLRADAARVHARFAANDLSVKRVLYVWRTIDGGSTIKTGAVCLVVGK